MAEIEDLQNFRRHNVIVNIISGYCKCRDLWLLSAMEVYMKIIDNYYRRQITKLKSLLKFKQREVDKFHADAKNYEVEIQKLHSFYKTEIKKA